jgi:hypothetical protein
VWLNVLGLDAVMTALVWMALFARVTGARLIPGEYVVLGCAVWCLYAADRMMDGMMPGDWQSERHRFARRRWRWLLAGIVAATALSAWLLAWHIREIVSLWGGKLLAAVALYFGVTFVSRRGWSGIVGAGSLGGLLAIGLMQGTATGMIWPQLWRGALAGILVTVLYLSLRHPGVPAPWTLPRKLLGGWLFAMGTALAPYAHKEQARELMFSGPVLMFGSVCALNSLGIRLWEGKQADFEHRLLSGLYPWMLVTVTAGAVMEWAVADQWSRLVLGSCGISAALMILLHMARRRLSVDKARSLADAAMILSAALMLGLQALRR